MSVGTALTNYETIGLPEGFREETATPIPLTSTIGILTVHKDTIINENYILQVNLTAEVKFEGDKYVAIDYQVDEYGIGNSLEEAQQDLLDSLVDYLTSLERREDRLVDRERHNLQTLRSILIKNGLSRHKKHFS